jgi:hypothetical protein
MELGKFIPCPVHRLDGCGSIDAFAKLVDQLADLPNQVSTIANKIDALHQFLSAVHSIFLGQWTSVPAGVVTRRIMLSWRVFRFSSVMLCVITRVTLAV